LVDAWVGVASSAALLMNPQNIKGIFKAPSAWNGYYSQPGMTRETKGASGQLANSTRLVRPLWHFAHRFQQLRCLPLAIVFDLLGWCADGINVGLIKVAKASIFIHRALVVFAAIVML
jgi:hypothetical protein